MSPRTSLSRITLLFVVAPSLTISCSGEGQTSSDGTGSAGPIYVHDNSVGTGGLSTATGGAPLGSGGDFGTGGFELGTGGFVATGGFFQTGGTTATGGLIGTGGADLSTGGFVGSGGVEMGSGGMGSGGMGSGGMGSGGMGSGGMGSGGTLDPGCSDNLPTNTDWPEATCQMWADAGECSSQWFIDQGACEQSCGYCSSGSGGMSGDGDGDTGTGGMGTGGTLDPGCTNNLPTGTGWPEATCQMWADAGECDSPWFIDQGACEQSCGYCSGGSGGMGGDGDGDGDGDTGTGGSGGEVTIPDLQGGTNGYATRYWDCCKPSCGWTANASNPVDSCDINGNNIGVNDQSSNGCQGGSAFTCESWAPWAKSDSLSYGFAAFNGAPCGTCFQIRFSGTSSHGQSTPGIEGKQMIVQVTNIGGLESNQFDILIPGGGVGDFNGCSTQWGVSNSTLGAQFGGFRATCGNDATCIQNMCQAAFGDSPDLMAGCDWYINWFQMADNPDIRYQEIECPQEIRNRSGG